MSMLQHLLVGLKIVGNIQPLYHQPSLQDASTWPRNTVEQKIKIKDTHSKKVKNLKLRELKKALTGFLTDTFTGWSF